VNRLTNHGSTSPQAFYVYSTIKIITASAVTLSNGQLACATTSTFNYPAISPTGSDIFTGINSYAEAYFGYLGFAGYTTSTETVSPLSTIDYQASTYLASYVQSDHTSVYPYVLPGKTSTQFAQVQYAVNTANSSIASLPAPSAIEISFSTPFVYLPTYGATEDTFLGNQDPANCMDIHGQNNTPTRFGYVPQDLIDWAAQNTNYLEQYPALSDCLPGGPSIIQPSNCILFSPETYVKATDLTIATAVTTNSIGCLGPGNCPQPSASSLISMKQSSQSAAVGPVEVGGPTRSSARNPTGSTSQGGMLQATPLQTKPAQSQAAAPQVQITPAPSQTKPSQSATNAMYSAITADGQLFTIEIIPQAVLNGQTIDTGAPPVTISGLVLSLAASGAAVGINGMNSILSANAPFVSDVVVLPVITIGSSTIFANSASDFMINDQTLVPGASAITISGTVISLAPSATAIVIDGITAPVSRATVTEYLIGGQTLVPGASAITVSGKIISLDSLATAVVVDGSTVIEASPIAAQPAPVITVGTQLVTADSASKYVFGGQTLTQGESAVTISGSVIKFAPVPSNTVVKAPVITFGTQQITADSASNFVLGSQTITPGETAITISGTVIPIVPPPSDIRIRTGSNASSATYPLQTFNSAGSRRRVLRSQELATMMMCVAMLLMC